MCFSPSTTPRPCYFSPRTYFTPRPYFQVLLCFPLPSCSSRTHHAKNATMQSSSVSWLIFKERSRQHRRIRLKSERCTRSTPPPASGRGLSGIFVFFSFSVDGHGLVGALTLGKFLVCGWEDEFDKFYNLKAIRENFTRKICAVSGKIR